MGQGPLPSSRTTARSVRLSLPTTLASTPPPVSELHLKRVSSLHDVGIGEHQPLGIKNHTTAPLTALHSRTWG